jgi:hypothetical protein
MGSGHVMRLAVALLILQMPVVHAATHAQVMASRYLRTQFCIERAIGQRWHERYDIPMVINRWGISEPTEAGPAKGSDALRRAFIRCRSENEIAGEPIPR